MEKFRVVQTVSSGESFSPSSASPGARRPERLPTYTHFFPKGLLLRLSARDCLDKYLYATKNEATQ